MKANAKILGLACAVALSGSWVWGQFVPTNSTPNSPQPTPIVHDDRQSHNSPTNEIVEPSGAISTNRAPDMTNGPTLKTPPPTPLNNPPK